MSERQRPEERITAAIVAQLEAGVRPWTQPWANGPAPAMPLRSTGEAYRGINTVMLWLRASNEGWTAPHWMTYRQAKELGGQVRKGEASTLVVYYGQSQAKDDGGDGDGEGRAFRFLKGYPVFNVSQIDGLPDSFYPAPVENPVPAEVAAWDDRHDAFLAATGADISWAGSSAYYAPGPDHIRLPERSLFRDAEHGYSTAFHELIHWTGAKHRLDRTVGKRFGDADYAREELVAEMGAAFLGAHMGLRPDHIEDHSAYLDHWIKILKTDSRAILKAASAAQTAADFVMAAAGKQMPADMAEAA
jgi:antirestriction protein ArdC